MYELISKFLPEAPVYEAYALYPQCKRSGYVSIGNEFPLDVADILPDEEEITIE